MKTIKFKGYQTYKRLIKTMPESEAIDKVKELRHRAGLDNVIIGTQLRWFKKLDGSE